MIDLVLKKPLDLIGRVGKLESKSLFLTLLGFTFLSLYKEIINITNSGRFHLSHLGTLIW